MLLSSNVFVDLCQEQLEMSTVVPQSEISMEIFRKHFPQQYLLTKHVIVLN